MPHPRTDHVTIQHLVNSIYQIELWCDAVRQLLECLPPEMCVPVCDRKTGADWKGGDVILKVAGCPPPRTKLKVSGCPPPSRIKVIGCPPPARLKVVGCPPPGSSSGRLQRKKRA